MYWQTAEVLTSIASLILSNERFNVNEKTLKSICYIFPFALLELRGKPILELGDSLLFLLEYHIDHLNEILMPSEPQILWIINRGNLDLKENTIMYWLQNGDVEVLIKVMNKSNYSLILLDILVNEDLDKYLTER